jgi:hypothetical protein
MRSIKGLVCNSLVRGLALAVAAIGFIAAMSAATPAEAAKRVALVIGNDTYKNVPALQKAISDAKAVGETLKGLGFQVIASENVSQRSMNEALAALDRIIEPGDVAFFFFAGHGYEIRGLNYLLPVDVPAATFGQEELVRDASFAVDRLVERMQSRGAATIILALDACRNNPFERAGTRSLGGAAGLAAMQAPEGVFVIYSAGTKQEALDRLSDNDGDKNSVFTRNFIKQLGTPGLSMVQVAKRTQADVKQLALTVKHDQTPAYYDQIVGDLILKPGDGQRVIEPVAQPRQQVAVLPPQQNVQRVLAPQSNDNNPVVNAPLVSFTRSNSGWHGNISLPEAATAIAWRFGEGGPFRETGVLDVLDQRTGRRMPNPSFELDSDTPSGTVYVRYVDPAGVQVGPFAIAFEPTSALVREQMRTINMISGSWLSFRDFNGVILYYTMLVSYRCAIKELRIGLDKATPDQPLPLPACDEKNPHALPGNFNPYLKVAPTTRSVSAQIIFQDGSRSDIKQFKR